MHKNFFFQALFVLFSKREKLLETSIHFQTKNIYKNGFPTHLLSKTSNNNE
jgi:hypothetical protein